jgi:hypothetical protein
MVLFSCNGIYPNHERLFIIPECFCILIDKPWLLLQLKIVELWLLYTN